MTGYGPSRAETVAVLVLLLSLANPSNEKAARKISHSPASKHLNLSRLATSTPTQAPRDQRRDVIIRPEPIYIGDPNASAVIPPAIVNVSFHGSSTFRPGDNPYFEVVVVGGSVRIERLEFWLSNDESLHCDSNSSDSIRTLKLGETAACILQFEVDDTWISDKFYLSDVNLETVNLDSETYNYSGPLHLCIQYYKGISWEYNASTGIRRTALSRLTIICIRTCVMTTVGNGWRVVTTA